MRPNSRYWSFILMLTYTQLKDVKTFCAALHSAPDFKEVVTSLTEYATPDTIVDHNDSMPDDFEVDNVRFIRYDAIDSIQEQELGSDLYMLGCFNSGFLASALDIDEDVIVALQAAEAYEALGKMIISMGKLEEVQQGYSSADGYGHHFNHYDFGEESVSFAGTDYFVFDNH